MRRSRIDALVDRRDRARRHAGAAIDALIRMNVEHRRLREFGLVFPWMNAVHRANVHAGGVLRFDARVGDDERHARESPLSDVRLTGPIQSAFPMLEPTDYTLRETQKTSSGSTAADSPATRRAAGRPGSR